MERIRYEDCNNNSKFLIKLITEAQSKLDDNCWLISDLVLKPKYRGDYSSNSENRTEEVAYNFARRMESEKTCIMTYDELVRILNDTKTVENAVIIAFSREKNIDAGSFRPMVESKNPSMISHEEAMYEIRILDGDLFYIFDTRPCDE